MMQVMNSDVHGRKGTPIHSNRVLARWDRASSCSACYDVSAQVVVEQQQEQDGKYSNTRPQSGPALHKCHIVPRSQANSGW